MYETHDKRALLLPNVTPADAGKVLAVDENGKLSLEEMSGGGDVMTVIISDGASSVSESIEDILLALSSGKSVIAVYDDSYTCLLSYDNNISGVSGVALESFDSGTAGCYVISGYNDGTSDVWDVGEYSYSSGSGSDAFIITFTYGETYGDYTADKTWQDVYDAMEDGKLIMAIFTNPDATYGFVKYAFCNYVYHYTGSDLQSPPAYKAEFGGIITGSTTPSDYLYADSAY